MRRQAVLVVAAALLALATAGFGAETGAPPSGLSKDEEQAILEEAEAYLQWPPEEEIPLPLEGWYTVELGGETVQIFRDDYGVPHIFAPSIEAAFRGQAYAIMEDRCIQVLDTRVAVRGLLSAQKGPSEIHLDEVVRLRSDNEEGLRAQVDALRPDLRAYVRAYVEGMNAYLERYAPQAKPIADTDVVAGAVFFMTRFGDDASEQLDLFKLLSIMKFLRGEHFANRLLADCLPIDVPNAPTTDHSHKGGPRQASKDSVAPAAGFRPEDMVSVIEKRMAARACAVRNNLFTRWGSQVWTVAPERSATGNAMLFSGPMLRFRVPAQAAQSHLVAPGLNATGLSFLGVPGIIAGHNERIAWGSTSGMVNVTDLFVETLNPDNPRQYRHNGEWKDMDVFESPIPVRNSDGELELRPFTVCRTVHGPVVHWSPYNHQAYTRCSSTSGHQLESFAAFMDINFAKDVYDCGKAIREISTCHNFVAADVEGNIGYWLSGRIPSRYPGQNPSLPTPGTGPYDWRGVTVATDLVTSINPPEGWFANFNGKPSVKTPGWWPERLWGWQLNKGIEENNPIDWDTFISLNQANGQNCFASSFFKPYVVKLLSERHGGDKQLQQAGKIIEEWPCNDVVDATGALLLTEWCMEVIYELMSPDFAGFVERSMSTDNLQLFGLLTFRVLCPEASGIELQGDYLHGRDKDEVALDCFKKILKKLTDAHGPDMTQWPYEPHMRNLGNLARFSERYCGVYWIVSELSQPIRSMDMLVPGQSAQSRSEHYKDQVDLFLNWKFKEVKYLPEHFEFPEGRPVAWKEK